MHVGILRISGVDSSQDISRAEEQQADFCNQNIHNCPALVELIRTEVKHLESSPSRPRSAATSAHKHTHRRALLLSFSSPLYRSRQSKARHLRIRLIRRRRAIQQRLRTLRVTAYNLCPSLNAWRYTCLFSFLKF
jgi:hypothetical protein